MVFELQHRPPTHVSPGLHLFIGWHEQPSDPGAQSVGSTEPEAPAGIWHFPDTQTPLAQSGPVEQVVFGSFPAGMQSPPVHVPLWQSLAWAQDEPAGEAPPELEPPPELDPPELEPPELEPPADVEPPPELDPPVNVAPPEDVAPPEPPSFEPWHTPPTHG